MPKIAKHPNIFVLLSLVAFVIAGLLFFQNQAAQSDAGAPSTVKPTLADIASHMAASANPRYLRIPELNVKARITPLGTIKDNQLAAPANVYDVGWYRKSARPGELGATLLDGHVSSKKTHGVFYGLRILKPGDTIFIDTGDGREIAYKVVTSREYNAGAVDMKAALLPVKPTRSALNLITCSGGVIAGTNQFEKRLIVFAVQV